MKAIDVVKIMAVGMEILSKSDIRTKDYRYINLYEEYCRMRSEGHKYEYAVADNRHLAMFVKQTLDDIDACEGQTFNRWYADMCLAGEQQYIDWEDMI